MEKVEIFFCYSHKDERLSQQLKKHLYALRRQGLIDAWHDRDIDAGTEWEREISKQIDNADIILPLISPDFLASDYVFSKEMDRAIERHERGQARAIPIILRPTDWYNTPLRKLQALPKDGKPITLWANRDLAFFDVAEGIRKAVQEFKTFPASEGKQVPHKLAHEVGNLGLGIHQGALVVYATKELLGVTVDLYVGFHSENRLHSSSIITKGKVGGQDMFLCTFPSLEPNDYTVFIDWKYYAKVGVSANDVTEVDWRDNVPTF